MSDSDYKIAADREYRPGTVVEKDGVHFGIYSHGKTTELVLYRKGTEEIAARIPFPETCEPGGLYCMKVKFRTALFEYNFCVDGKIIQDPYAKKICGHDTFGKIPEGSEHAVRCGFAAKAFSWDGDRRPQIPYDEAVMYHLHVRGFTMQKNSGVRKKGTFAGLTQKLPYLKDLGINQIKLMPCYDFPEMVSTLDLRRIPESQKEAVLHSTVRMDEKERFKMNYWGYGPGFYFAPKASYSASADPDIEFKTMVREAHRLGIEVLMEFQFTDETDIVFMAECLQYWAQEYHVDGFSVISREGIPAELARLPLFRTVKLVCGWFPQDITDRNRDVHALLGESNDGFMNDCRRFLKGDEDMVRTFTDRQRRSLKGCAVINYISNHDGFTLEDLVTYDRKHNRDNGESERDGTDYNYSWNCGVEGPTRRKEILNLRMRQKKNALAMLLFAQGTPMLLAGDEFGNSQNGNNNPYCHDSELTWLTWSGSRSAKQMQQFVKDALNYRKIHKVFHQNRVLSGMDSRSVGYPDLSFHGDRAWFSDFDRVTRHVGCMYAGSYAGENGYFYIAYNMYWAEQEFALPLLPARAGWFKVMDTSLTVSFPEQPEAMGRVKTFHVPPRTIMILEGRENEAVRKSEKNHMEKDKRAL